MDDIDPDDMAHPCKCPLCEEWVELAGMKSAVNGRKRINVCPDCWDDLVQEA